MDIMNVIVIVSLVSTIWQYSITDLFVDYNENLCKDANLLTIRK